MKIGVITDCFKKGVAESLSLASSLGFDGIQIYATGGEFSPEAMNDEAIAAFNSRLAECGLCVSALCGDMGGHGFEIEADNPTRVEKTKAIIDLARKVGAPVVTTHIGVIPSDPTDPTYIAMLRALTACGEYAKSRGVTMAIETGPEDAVTLSGFVNAAGDGVGVNLDPANFVMVTGQDPAAAVRLLGKKIVHTHLKDGRMLKKTEPKIIYGHFADGGIEALNVADFFIETPVGEGDVNWDEYIAALREIGYDGFLTIERETGDDPTADIIKARDFVVERGYI
ncbi:MAG: sugar phosphate isomerase/epimerase [Clostridia bacterium]|nr:sugar phosphate isomerase/epimerase [Clostridia bacterium]